MSTARGTSHCHLWSVQLHKIFPLYLIDNKIFEKKEDIEYKMCFDLLYKFETFVILRRTERYTDRPTERPTDRPTDQPNTHASPHLNSPILTSYFNET